MDSPSADHGHSDERASSNGAPVVDRRGQDAFAIGTFLASAPRRDRLGTSRRSIRPRVHEYLGRAIRCRARTARKVGSGTHSDRKSVVSGKSVSVRVDLGGRRIIKKKKRSKQQAKEC